MAGAAKADVAKAVVARYPELKAYLVRDPKWKQRFHANMFDAVALAMLIAQWREAFWLAHTLPVRRRFAE